MLRNSLNCFDFIPKDDAVSMVWMKKKPKIGFFFIWDR